MYHCIWKEWKDLMECVLTCLLTHIVPFQKALSIFSVDLSAAVK